ncbi:hypothetical protein GEMRC1_009699 [Eukaryota sp. GEM-RC1]
MHILNSDAVALSEVFASNNTLKKIYLSLGFYDRERFYYEDEDEEVLIPQLFQSSGIESFTVLGGGCLDFDHFNALKANVSLKELNMNVPFNGDAFAEYFNKSCSLKNSNYVCMMDVPNIHQFLNHLNLIPLYQC